MIEFFNFWLENVVCSYDHDQDKIFFLRLDQLFSFYWAIAKSSFSYEVFCLYLEFYTIIFRQSWYFDWVDDIAISPGNRSYLLAKGNITLADITVCKWKILNFCLISLGLKFWFLVWSGNFHGTKLWNLCYFICS